MKVKAFQIFFPVVVLFLFALGSCHNTSNPNEANTKDSTVIDEKSTASIWGVFADTIPCADCKGIVTKLFLNKDYTFIKEENYMGAQDTLPHIFYDLGKWQLKDSIISLHDQIQGGNNQYKLLSNGNIQMMAEDGTIMVDSTKTSYNLQLIGKTFHTIKPFLISGIVDKSTSKTSILICAWDKNQTLILNKTMLAQLEDFWKKLKDPTTSKAILQAEVTLDEHTSEQLIVTKLVNLMDGSNCN